MLTAAVLEWAAQLVDVLAADHLFHYIAVFLPDGSNSALVLAGQRWGSDAHQRASEIGTLTVPIEGSVVGRVYRTGSPSLVADTRHDPDYRDFPGGGNRSELAVPIVAGDRIVGVVNLESPRVGTFGIADLDRVQAILIREMASSPIALSGNGRAG